LHFGEIGGKVGELLGVRIEKFCPGRSEIAAAFTDAVLEVVVDAIRHEEFCVFGPTVIFLYQLDFGFAESGSPCASYESCL